MIAPKLIPAAVVEAVASVIASDDGWGFQATAYEETARAAIAAGLTAWPGVFEEYVNVSHEEARPCFVLPQEPRHD